MLAAITDTFKLQFFSDFKTKLDSNALFRTSTHRKYRYDINARVNSAICYSQLNKGSHFQLVSWVAKTCTNVSRLVASESHPVNKHYNSNPDNIWTNLAVRCVSTTAGWSNTTYSQQTAHQLLLFSVVEMNKNLYTVLFVFKKCTISIHKTNIFFTISTSNDYIVYINIL